MGSVPQNSEEVDVQEGVSLGTESAGGRALRDHERTGASREGMSLGGSG